MHISAGAVLLGLAMTSIALPVPLGRLQPRQAIEAQSYADFQVSDGTAGNALAEVNARFPIDDFANVSEGDLQILKDEREVAEDAEVGAGGFNERIAAATSDAEATALQTGKIKNKVLKLQLEVIAIQVEGAQGNLAQGKLDEEMGKLNNNVALDLKAAGQDSLGVTDSFSA